jgi:hypothetical protein
MGSDLGFPGLYASEATYKGVYFVDFLLVGSANADFVFNLLGDPCETLPAQKIQQFTIQFCPSISCNPRDVFTAPC